MSDVFKEDGLTSYLNEAGTRRISAEAKRFSLRSLASMVLMSPGSQFSKPATAYIAFFHHFAYF